MPNVDEWLIEYFRNRASKKKNTMRDWLRFASRTGIAGKIRKRAEKANEI